MGTSRSRPALALAAAVLATIASPAPAADAASVAPTQALVRLLAPHRVASALRARPWVGRLTATRPITGGPTVLPVVATATTSDGRRWLRVMLPGRPNGATGWITRTRTQPETTRWHVVVRTDSRRVLVYREGHRARSFRAIVGKPSTPTPHGRFFVEESVRMLPRSAGAPFALASSARSNVLQEFAGGPGQIAIHGTGNIGGTLGTAASHGCVRLGDRAIRWMAAHITPGVPLTITR